MLDVLVDAVRSTIDQTSLPKVPTKAQVRQISQTIGAVLIARGFRLYVNTETLSDALTPRNGPREPERYHFDCDTGSFLYLTVADDLGLTASLVDINPGLAALGHNYVRWMTDAGPLDWDTNGRYECTTPPGLPDHQGKTMTREQTRGYALTLRAELFKRRGAFQQAVEDFRSAMRMYPESPIPFNNFAWLVATRRWDGSAALKGEALKAAERAVSVERSANFLDTLACTCASQGDFERAIKYSAEAAQSGETAIVRRLDQLRQHHDCTGSD